MALTSSAQLDIFAGYFLFNRLQFMARSALDSYVSHWPQCSLLLSINFPAPSFSEYIGPLSYCNQVPSSFGHCVTLSR